jgi:hypothetical protein
MRSEEVTIRTRSRSINSREREEVRVGKEAHSGKMPKDSKEIYASD